MGTKKRNLVNNIIAGISGFALFTSLFLTVIFCIGFNRSFYAWQYALGRTYETIGMSMGGLMRSTDALLDYIQNKRGDIIIRENVNGIEREIFNRRETLHMVDVKNLYINAMNLRNILLITSISVIVILCLINRKAIYSVLLCVYRNGLIVVAAVIGFLATWACIDFDGFWMNFHYVLFNNDLFLLDPNVSIMINMFPSNFFFALVMGIVLAFALIIVLMGIGLFTYKKYLKKKHS